MGKLILITGGARSGKSLFAESIVKKYEGNILYVATAVPFDDEMKFRVQKHKEQRPQNWETIEAYKELDKKIGEKVSGKSAVLLDCVTIMVSNLMLEQSMDWKNISSMEINGVEEAVKTEIEKILTVAQSHQIPFVIVTNELGMGVVPPYELGRAIRDIAGRENQILARAADEVYLCVSGIPVKIK